MNHSIVLTNNDIANYAMFMLNKLENQFSKDELDQIEEIVINGFDEKNLNFWKDLSYFSNLKSITFRNIFFYRKDSFFFSLFPFLQELVFEHCEFEDIHFLSSISLSSLSFINCSILSFDFLSMFSNLSHLTIVHSEISCSVLSQLKNLHYLQLSYSKIDHLEHLFLDELEEIYIDNTNLYSLEFLTHFPNLKRASIDILQYQRNRDIIESLSSKVLFLNENMVVFGGN